MTTFVTKFQRFKARRSENFEVYKYTEKNFHESQSKDMKLSSLREICRRYDSRKDVMRITYLVISLSDKLVLLPSILLILTLTSSPTLITSVTFSTRRGASSEI